MAKEFCVWVMVSQKRTGECRWICKIHEGHVKTTYDGRKW